MRNHQGAETQEAEPSAKQPWAHLGPDFVMMEDVKPPQRIALARERMLMCRMYLGLIRSISDDYGAPFAANSDSASLRTIGIYVLLRTLMCSPAPASTIARALKLPRPTVLRRLQELARSGYVERIGNAYRVTDSVNIPDLQEKVRRRIAMIVETANKLSELNATVRSPPTAPEPGEP